MKIGLDTRMLRYSGIGVTIEELLRALTPEQRAQIQQVGAETNYPIYTLRQHWGYGRLLNRQRFDLYHMPHYDVPLSYRGRLVVTVHDLIHYLFPEYSSKPFSRLYARFVLGCAVARAKKVIVVSSHTESDLHKHFPKSKGKTVVIPPAAGGQFAPVEDPTLGKVLKSHRLERGYLLYVGNLRPSKNTKNLIMGYAALKKERTDTPPLVLVGKSFYKEGELENISDSVRFLGTVDHDDLPALYTGASLFVFPSLYEGFGLPPLEAMSCGTPVLSSRAASLPEVCGKAAEYFDDLSSEAIADKLRVLLSTPERLAQMREAGLRQAKQFSWKSFAEKTWRVYEEVAGGPR